MIRPTPWLALLSAVSVMGCAAIHRNAERANDSLYEGSKKSRAKIASWIYEEEQPEVTPPPPPQRYCYNLRSDVICYDQPRSQLRNQRVGTGEQEYGQGYGYGQYDAYSGLPARAFDAEAAANFDGDRFDPLSREPSEGFIPAAPEILGVDDSVSAGTMAGSPFAPASSANAQAAGTANAAPKPLIQR